MNWSVRRDKKYRLAITSLLEQYPNRVEITIFILDKGCQRPISSPPPATSSAYGESPTIAPASSSSRASTATRKASYAVDTQLIAHDKEVLDIAWGGVGVFASVSADGSVRVFYLRDKEHSTIIYESSVLILC
ncbi:unnamed protein product [Brassica oleracea var. botrytis]